MPRNGSLPALEQIATPKSCVLYRLGVKENGPVKYLARKPQYSHRGFWILKISGQSGSGIVTARKTPRIPIFK